MSNISLFDLAGAPIPDNLPNTKVSTVFEATGLDWDVIQKPVLVPNGNNPNTTFGSLCYDPIPSLVANFRSSDNKFLGAVHPNTYKVVQNYEAFDFIDELPNFTFEKVGEFCGGKKVFVVGKSNDQIAIDGSSDLVNFYLTFLHGHDGKSGIKFILCPIRMFCMNQLNLMLEKANFKYNITHTGDIEWKLSRIQKAIADSKNYVTGLEDTIKHMISTKLNIDPERFLSVLIPEDDDDSEKTILNKEMTRNTIIDLYKNKDDLQNYKGTVFGMVSAVSDYVSHVTPKRSHGTSTVNNLFINNMEGNKLIQTAKTLLAA